jgi:hypothetical protein
MHWLWYFSTSGSKFAYGGGGPMSTRYGGTPIGAAHVLGRHPQLFDQLGIDRRHRELLERQAIAGDQRVAGLLRIDRLEQPRRGLV